jgi:peptidoglycan/xylan/chitin deacetylase (PgdA/CDA1 family)
LQHVLPQALRGEIIKELFSEYIGKSNQEFSNELYMSLEEIKSLVKVGMHVGSHGSRHCWLDKISEEEQEEDISKSLSFLEEIGASTSDWVMCYPYGAYNANTLSIINRLGALAGVTTKVKLADLSSDNPLLLPRFDTNDFPT